MAILIFRNINITTARYDIIVVKRYFKYLEYELYEFILANEIEAKNLVISFCAIDVVKVEATFYASMIYRRNKYPGKIILLMLIFYILSTICCNLLFLLIVSAMKNNQPPILVQADSRIFLITASLWQQPFSS